MTNPAPTEADRTDLLPSEAARFEEVCRLGLDQLESIATTVALSFADDPVWRWMFSGDQSPMTTEQMMALARYLVDSMVAPREIHGFRHHRCVALWHPPVSDTPNDHDQQIEQQRNAAFVAQVASLLHDPAAVGEFSAALHAHRPLEPNWYLGVIGTHPDHQGKGLGAQVLRSMHSRTDALGVATYLESSNPANHSFYRQNGYTETTEFSGGGSPALLGFWRDPA